jgi:hypothetical protein
LLVAVAATRGDEPTTRPADISLADISGVMREPLEVGRARASVVIFIGAECPISNGYAPEINRICKEFEEHDVKFYLVHADADLSDAQAKKHAADFGFTCPVMVDRKHALVHAEGAKVTPEVVVIGKDNKVVYRGRIDNQYAAIGSQRFKATTHDLRDALQAIVDGKPVENARTEAVGCSISQ